jgi:predicted ATP-dependent Lon-type protease
MIPLPMASAKDIPTISGELFAKFQTGFYADPADAVFKALGIQKFLRKAATRIALLNTRN